jgi:hypothetical protein
VPLSYESLCTYTPRQLEMTSNPYEVLLDEYEGTEEETEDALMVSNESGWNYDNPMTVQDRENEDDGRVSPLGTKKVTLVRDPK